MASILVGHDNETARFAFQRPKTGGRQLRPAAASSRLGNQKSGGASTTTFFMMKKVEVR
jgi:hypothetical protein